MEYDRSVETSAFVHYTPSRIFDGQSDWDPPPWSGNSMKGIWRQSGYEDFAAGVFGNGGQNLYVSQAGVLQRIHHFDFNKDGYADLLFVNSQDMDERPPVCVYVRPMRSSTPIELPTQGAYAGAVGDLNRDGFDDLVLAHQNNGVHSDVTAYVYYGSAEGYSERRRIELPAPNSRAVAIGDFNGDGRPDIAFSSDGHLRIFYQQEHGFVAGKLVDLKLEVTHMAAGDIDRDGFCDLYVRIRGGQPTVLWGGKQGLHAVARKNVGGADAAAVALPSSTPARMAFAEGWLPRILHLSGSVFLFRMEGDEVCLYPVNESRAVGKPLRLHCPGVVSAAAGRIGGSRGEDLVLAVCTDKTRVERSWVYWWSEKGYSNRKRAALETQSARDVVVAPLGSGGAPHIVFCQGSTEERLTTESLIYRTARGRIARVPRRLRTLDATMVLTAKAAGQTHLIFINHESGRVRGDVPAYVYYGGKDGFSSKRRAELPGWSAPAALSCDFNDDGWADILIANCAENAPHMDPGSYLYWGSAEGFSPKLRQVLPTLRAHGCAAGDFRRVGYLDIAVAGFCNAELLIFKGGPKGFRADLVDRIILDPRLKSYTPVRPSTPDEVRALFAENMVGTSGIAACEYQEPRWLLAADFNNDGWLDLFVSQCCGQRCLILWGGPDGFSMARSQWLAAEGGICAQAADLTGNGWLDLIIGGHQSQSRNWRYDSSVYIYWGGPQGYSENQRMQLPAHMANSLAVADFNNDGILDIFCTSYNAGRDRDTDSFIYWGQPGGRYSEKNVTRLFTHSACGCVAADFNHDGWVDLAVANHKTNGNHVGNSVVWWNSPDGFSDERVTELPTLGPHGMLGVPTGNILDRGPEEYFISSPFLLPENARVDKIAWKAEIPPNTWVRAQLRSAVTAEQLAQATWHGAGGRERWLENGQNIARMRQPGRWVQYRLALGAANGGNSPRVTEVALSWDEKSQR